MSRRLPAAVAAFAVLSMVVLVDEAAAAVPSTSIGAALVRSAGHDYWADAFSDDMDFANLEDLPPSRQKFGVATSMSGGSLNILSSALYSRIRLIDSAFTPIPNRSVREGNSTPVNTATFRRLSFRMYLDPASLGSDQAGLGMIVFSHCPAANCSTTVPAPPAAEGVKPFHLRAGWHTYDLDLSAIDSDSTGLSPYGAPWTFGPARMLAIQFNSNGQDAATGSLDWVRLYEPNTTNVTATFGGGSGAFDVWYDTDGTTANNGTPSAQGATAGLLSRSLTGSSATIDLGRLPPGVIRLVAQQAGTNGSASATLTLDAPPQPSVINPDAAGDGDWAQSVRGNAWDFSDSADVFTIANGGPSVLNAAYSITGGQLHGLGANADPQVYLTDSADRGGAIDANEWHRLSFRIAFDGNWGTGTGPGEGMALRVCWFVVGSNIPQCSWELITALEATDYSIELTTSPTSEIIPPDYQSRSGWGGGVAPQTMLLRIDPHEDPGARGWHLDSVRLSHDDRVPIGGWVPIQFRDNAHEPGTTVDIYADTDPGPGLGTLIFDNLAASAGLNTVNWDGSGVPAGRFDIVVVSTDPRGASTTSRSTGPVQVLQPPSPNPFGSLDSVTTGPGTVSAAGWVIDRDAGTGPTNVHLYVDGVGHNLGSATLPRGDVGAAYAAYGANHGFNATVPATPGQHTVCAYGINSGPGANSQLGCRVVTVPTGSPFGSFDMARWHGAGGIRVAGWAIDPDTASPIEIHAYVDGVGRSLGTAQAPRGDLAAAYPGYGPSHGFDTILTGVPGGARTICLYAINTGAGTNSGLGCGTVTVGSGSPYGALDLTQFGSAGAVVAAGWAFDPDNAAPTEVHVYLYGPDGRLVNAKPGIFGTLPRPDIPLVFPGWDNRAFHSSFVSGGLPSGTFTACGYAINAPGTSGANSFLGCRSLLVPSTPFGTLDAATSPSAGQLRVAGWTIDPDTTDPIGLHVYVDGVGYNLGVANDDRPDLAFIGYGSRHGYARTIAGLNAGVRQVCVYGINAGPGGNTALGCRSVTIG